MGKTVIKLFLETMLRAIVIILAIGIVIMFALLAKTLHNNSKLKDEKATSERAEIETEEEDENDPTFTKENAGDGEEDASEEGKEGNGDGDASSDSKSAKILVINATGTGGVAGSWKTTLEGEGYSSVEVGNYQPGIITTTKVCVSDNYTGDDLAEKFTSPERNSKSDLNASDFDVSIDDFDIVIVVGTQDVK